LQDGMIIHQYSYTHTNHKAFLTKETNMTDLSAKKIGGFYSSEKCSYFAFLLLLQIQPNNAINLMISKSKDNQVVQ